MSPDEQRMLAGLFDRTRQAAHAPRDPDAERFIADQVRSQPYAPYLLAQSVLMQEQALEAANQRIMQLEEEVARARQAQPAPQPASGGGFLGGLFGGRSAAPPPPPPQAMQPPPSFGGRPGYAAPAASPWGGPQGAPPQGMMAPQGGMPYPPQGGMPYPPQGAPAPQGGGFMKGALATAAGVAGGALLFQGISSAMGGGGLFGGSAHAAGSGAAGAGGGLLGSSAASSTGNPGGGSSPSGIDTWQPDSAGGATGGGIQDTGFGDTYDGGGGDGGGGGGDDWT